MCTEFLEFCDFYNYAITCVINLVGTFCYVLYLHTIYTFLEFYTKKQEVARNVQHEAVFLVEDANNEMKSAMGRTADKVYIRLCTVLVTKWDYSRMQYSISHLQWVCCQNASRDLCRPCSVCKLAPISTVDERIFSMYKMIPSEKL